MTTPFFRMPAIHTDALKIDENADYLLRQYFHNHSDYFDAITELFTGIEDYALGKEFLAAENDWLNELSDDIDNMDRNEMPPLGGNPVPVIRRLLADTPELSSDALIQGIKEAIPLLDFVEGDDEKTLSNIDKRCELGYNTVYPIYCKPSDEAVSSVLAADTSIGFLEIEGSWFIYLHSSGSDMSVDIGYGYLLVDDCIPNNILSGMPYQEMNPMITEAMNAYFNGVQL